MENRSYLGSITKYDIIGFGSFSNVYECDYLGSHFAYKEFDDPKYVEFISEKLKKLRKYNNDTRFVFPYQFIYTNLDDKYFVGYVMDYLYKYECLDDLKDLDYSKKLHILKKARELVEIFHSEYNFIHTDLCPWNFMYNKGSDDIKLIDFDSYLDLKDNNKILTKYNNIVAENYAKSQGIDKDLDIYMFNLLTYSLLNDVDFYLVINNILDNKFGFIENSKAIDILECYKDIETNTLKKEYVIDYL